MGRDIMRRARGGLISAHHFLSACSRALDTTTLGSVPRKDSGQWSVVRDQ